MSSKTLIAGAAALALCGFGSAHAATWIASGTSSDGALNGEAIITSASNVLTIQLTNLLANPTSAGQELSGVEIFFATAPTSASLSSSSGQLITIASTKNGDTWANDTKDTINHWGAVMSGGDLFLATAGTGAQGGKPSDLIIDGGGNYSNANPSITGHGPEIKGTGTFNVVLNGLTAPQITGVSLEFGTSPDHTLAASCSAGCDTLLGGGHGITAPVPEPAEWALMITGFFGAGALLRQRRRQADLAS